MSTLKINLTPPPPADPSASRFPGNRVGVEVEIDGKRFDELRSTWDFVELVKSARVPGGYFLGTCGCGDPGCNGAFVPITVEHDGEAVRWRIPKPYTTLGVDDPVAVGVTVLEFDAAQYRAEVDVMLSELGSATAACPELGIAGHNRAPLPVLLNELGA